MFELPNQLPNDLNPNILVEEETSQNLKIACRHSLMPCLPSTNKNLTIALENWQKSAKDCRYWSRYTFPNWLFRIWAFFQNVFRDESSSFPIPENNSHYAKAHKLKNHVFLITISYTYLNKSQNKDGIETRSSGLYKSSWRDLRHFSPGNFNLDRK